jgi:hypothetical protein
VVEGARLESVYAGDRIAGSNPAPSANASSSNILRWPASPQKSPINTGLHAQTSGLRRTRPRPKILSLRPFFSKAPDFADLVQNS